LYLVLKTRLDTPIKRNETVLNEVLKRIQMRWINP
jgi:hypothetical protein